MVFQLLLVYVHYHQDSWGVFWLVLKNSLLTESSVMICFVLLQGEKNTA